MVAGHYGNALTVQPAQSEHVRKTFRAADSATDRHPLFVLHAC